MRVPAALLALVVGLVPAVAAAQSLGEIAAREKARKEKEAREGKARPPVKVITQDDLRGRASAGTVSQPASDAAAASATSGSGATSASGGSGAAAGQAGKGE